MAAEALVLDPSEVSVSRTSFDLLPYVRQEGIDWGDSEIAAYMADQARGSSPVDFRVPNRTITIPLSLRQIGADSFDTVRQKIQAKVALFQQEGGWLKRAMVSGTFFADVVNATLHMPDSWTAVHRQADPEGQLTLECLPDFYGAEVTLSDHSTTTAGELIWTETGIAGNYPGRLRLVVDNDQATDQLGLVAAVRSKHYSAASTAALVYQAEDLTALDAASVTALTGSDGGNTIRHNSLNSGWTSVLSTQAVGGGAHMTHTGSYRVRARVYTTSTTDVQVRLVWDVGDLTLPVENSEVTIPGASNFYLADLGEVRLDQVPTGSHRWQGIVQGKGEAGGENLHVDKLWLEPLDEGWCLLRATTDRAEGVGSTGFRSPGTVADDSGTGTLAWSTASNAAASDNTYATAGGGVLAGDTHYLKATNFGFAVPTGATIQGIIVEVERSHFGSAAISDNRVRIVKGGTVQSTDRSKAGLWPATDAYRTYGSSTDLWGTTWAVSDINASNFGFAISAFLDSTVALVDHIKINVYYVEPSLSTSADAAVYASQSAELRWDGHFREDSTGAAYGPASHVDGDLLRVPPAGLEARTVQFLVKGSRGDLDQLPDSATGDDISAEAYYRPSWLFVPTT